MQCLEADLAALYPLPHLSNIEIRRVAASQFGLAGEHSYFLGIQKWGSWSKETGWSVLDKPEVVEDAAKSLEKCVESKCTDWACVGQTRIHQYPRRLLD